jgi:hypothetical protein
MEPAKKILGQSYKKAPKHIAKKCLGTKKDYKKLEKEYKHEYEM